MLYYLDFCLNSFLLNAYDDDGDDGADDVDGVYVCVRLVGMCLNESTRSTVHACWLQHNVKFSSTRYVRCFRLSGRHSVELLVTCMLAYMYSMLCMYTLHMFISNRAAGVVRCVIRINALPCIYICANLYA